MTCIILYLYGAQRMSIIVHSTDHTIQLNTFGSHLRELQLHVTPSNTPVLHVLGHINALLQRAVVVCKAATKVETPTTMSDHTLVKKDEIAPGQNSEHQWRFKKTVKSPGRKKSGIVLRYEIILYTLRSLLLVRLIEDYHCRRPTVEEKAVILQKREGKQDEVRYTCNISK